MAIQIYRQLQTPCYQQKLKMVLSVPYICHNGHVIYKNFVGSIPVLDYIPAYL